MFDKMVRKTISILNMRVLENKVLRAIVLVGISTIFYGASYAYYTGNVEGNTSSVVDTISTAKLRFNIADSKKIIFDNPTPGKKMIKEFSVQNYGTSTMSYSIAWDSLTNTFGEPAELVYSIDGTTTSFHNKQVPDTGNDISILDNIKIEPNTTHNYKLTMKFANINEGELTNVGRNIEGKLKIITNSASEGYSLTSELLKNNVPSNPTTSVGSETSTTNEGLISGKSDNDGKTYYFRGAVNNNYVTFAGYTWRIVRINGDGSVRMILNGTTGTNAVWNSTNDSTSGNNYQTELYNTMHSWSTYSNSPIKTNVETWYNNNIANNKVYSSKVVESYYCSDYSHGGTVKNVGMGTYNRTLIPEFTCTGNYKYKAKVGLINADEILFAGGKYNTNNTNFYLYTGSWYWTMSPAYWTTNGNVTSFYLNDSGKLDNRDVSGSGGIKPVINIDGNTLVTVNNSNPGTSSNPYIISSSGVSALGKPGAIKYSNIVATGVKVKWGEADNATYYKLERKTSTGAFITVSNNVTNNYYSDSGLTANTTYTYRVQACNSSGCNSEKKTSKITTGISVGAITTFTTTNATATTTDLNWSAATNAMYYKLERQTGIESYYMYDDHIESLSYTDSATNETTAYRYRIRGCARNSDNVEYCGDAMALRISTKLYVGSTGVPIGSGVTPTGDVISWTGGENATYYKVARKISGEENFTEISNRLTELTLSDTGLIPDTVYIYRVIACATYEGEESCSEPRYLTIRTAPIIGEISSISITNLTSYSLTVNWTAANHATYYMVERKLSSSQQYTTLTAYATDLTYNDTGLSHGTQYDYRVTPCAVSSTGNPYCGSSQTYSVTTPVDIGPSGAPTLSAVKAKEATITWTAGRNATYYKIARAVSGSSDYTTVSNNVTGVTYTDSGLTGNTTYTYRVTACVYLNSVETCAASQTGSITTEADIGDISTFSSSNVAEYSLTVNWTSASNATFYQLERKLSSASTYTTLTSNTTSLNYNDSGLDDGTTYDYRIRGCRKSSTNTTYCGNTKTLQVETEHAADPLTTLVIGKSPTTAGTVNSEGLMIVSQAATGQTPVQTSYRYTGSSPKNYITYNGETWRIVGIFSTDNGSGTYVNRARIMKDTVLSSTQKWNTSSNNNWTTASLNTYLNGDYYNSLTTAAKGQISTAKWYIGQVERDDYTTDCYSLERASSSSASGKLISWNSIVGLLYPSDYGYASSSCYSGTTKDLYNYDNSTCTGSTWMNGPSSNWWLISPNTGSTTYSMFISKNYMNYKSASGYSYNVRPVVHLNSDVEISSGTGTSSDPYIIYTR